MNFRISTDNTQKHIFANKLRHSRIFMRSSVQKQPQTVHTKCRRHRDGISNKISIQSDKQFKSYEFFSARNTIVRHNFSSYILCTLQICTSSSKN